MHAKRELQIHAWFYDLGAVEVFEWSEAQGDYQVVGHETRASIPAGAPEVPTPIAEEIQQPAGPE